MLHAEALLLVQHEQPEVAELHVFGQEPVRADDQIDLPLCKRREDLFLLVRGAEAAELFHLYAERRKARLRVLVMLAAQNGVRA